MCCAAFIPLPNRQIGRPDPSYTQIQKITGFCRETIAKALKNLELAGILEIMRRIVRERYGCWLKKRNGSS